MAHSQYYAEAGDCEHVSTYLRCAADCASKQFFGERGQGAF